MPTPIGSPRRALSDSRIPGTLPQSPIQVQKLKRQAMYKKSPVAKSPLRDVLKARCQERIRDNRSKLLDGKRGIQEAIRDEVASWRGGRFAKGVSDDDIEAAFEDLEEIEAELLLEEYGIDVRGEVGVEKMLEESICPVCQLGKISVKGDSLGGFVHCSGSCSYSIQWEEGMSEWEKCIERCVDDHNAGCGTALGFLAPPPGSAIMAMCQECDFCKTILGH